MGARANKIWEQGAQARLITSGSREHIYFLGAGSIEKFGSREHCSNNFWEQEAKPPP